MLITWMQQNCQMLSLPKIKFNEGVSLNTVESNSKEILKSLELHEQCSKENFIPHDKYMSAAQIFVEFIDFLAKKEDNTCFNVPRGKIEHIPRSTL